MPKESVRTYAIPTQEDNEAEGIIRASKIVIDSRPGCQGERIVIRDLGLIEHFKSDQYVVCQQFISHEGHDPCFSSGSYFNKKDGDRKVMTPEQREAKALEQAHERYEDRTKRLGMRI